MPVESMNVSVTQVGHDVCEPVVELLEQRGAHLLRRREVELAARRDEEPIAIGHQSHLERGREILTADHDDGIVSLRPSHVASDVGRQLGRWLRSQAV